jgi:ferredoxin-NADP reductase
MHEIRFIRSESLTKQIVTFCFQKPKNFSFEAGQFIEIHLSHPHPDLRGSRRWFTISSAPHKAEIQITTRIIPESSSFKKALLDLKPNNTVKISEPMGDFVLPKDPNIPLLFVAGGIGITPFHSIISQLAHTAQPRNITLLYAAKFSDDFVFEEVFLSGLIRYEKTIGSLQGKDIFYLYKQDPSQMLYISGPEKMVESLLLELHSLGVSKHQLHGDYFPNYPT